MSNKPDGCPDMLGGTKSAGSQCTVGTAMHFQDDVLCTDSSKSATQAEL